MDETDFAKLKILIVDDNVHMRVLLRRLLGTRGITQTADAEDGDAAMKLLSDYQFDLILSDLEMQPIDGIEFTRMVRRGRTNANIPIIMISGHTEVTKVRQARDVGVTEFLIKPVTPKSLFERISVIFANPRPFVSSDAYVGPERRRKQRLGLNPKRRSDDKNIVELD